MGRWLPLAYIALFVAANGLIAAGAEAKRRGFSPEELTNVHLGPDFSQWLVGPIARMATEAELKEYLEIREDEKAEQFIEGFWKERSSWTKWPSPSLRQIFDERGEEADRLFTEAAYPGRRTDRGAVFVVYGMPDERTFELPPLEGQPAIEVWRYSKSAPRGLDGRSPAKKVFRFQARDGITRFYDPLGVVRR